MLSNIFLSILNFFTTTDNDTSSFDIYKIFTLLLAVIVLFLSIQNYFLTSEIEDLNNAKIKYILETKKAESDFKINDLGIKLENEKDINLKVDAVQEAVKNLEIQKAKTQNKEQKNENKTNNISIIPFKF